MRVPTPTTLIIIAWVASEIVLSIARRSGTKSADSLDRSSFRVLWIVIMLSVTAGIMTSGSTLGVFGGKGTPWPLIGTVAIVAGIVVRWWAILSLKEAFTVDVAIAEGQRLVDRGMYRLIRHPSYTGSLLSFAGFGLVLGNAESLAVVLIPIIAAFLYRIGVEERALRAGLGEAYAQYMQRTRRLIPFVY